MDRHCIFILPTKCNVMNIRVCLLFIVSFATQQNFAQQQSGKASYYADKFEGRTTANGEKYRHFKLTAAHRTLPFGTEVKVTNIKNGKSVIVRINDRGPFVEGRIIDLSKSAAERLDFINEGIASVITEIVNPRNPKDEGQIQSNMNSVLQEKEFYTMDVDRVNPYGFGVQIGSFQEMANLVRLTQNLKASYKKKVTLQVKHMNNKKLYAIILGEFSNRGKANSFKQSITKRYPDAFIVDYSKL